MERCASRLNPTVAIVGSGNVASHLARAMAAAGCDVQVVLSRNIEHAQRLANEIGNGCRATDTLDDLGRYDYVLISCADDALAAVVDSLPHFGPETVVMHTSGTVPATVLAKRAERYGVLYPLQTFSREKPVEIAEVPFFNEANDEQTLGAIDALAGRLSEHVYHADGEKRRSLHIAGVLSCNFVTYLWEQAGKVLEEAGYTFDAVKPLVKATLAKTCAIGAHEAQTGPARRGDIEVMRRHIDALPEALRPIYKQLSQAIMDSHSINKIL